MSMIKVENLTFAYPGSYHNIFENCSFQIDTDWKLGFTGRNGRGKTTLLRLLQGEYEYTGSIRSSVSFGYFPCPVPDPEQLTADVLEEIAPEAAQWQFLREFAQLELSPDLLWQPFRTLSGGEQTKILLAALFLREGCFPLIDEPTNHLDTHGREILSRWLQRQKGYILISHDRAFLDSCTDHILSLNRSGVEVQAGRFSDWLENFQRRQQSEEEQSQRLQKEIRRLRDSARRASDWSDRAESAKFGSGPVDRGFIGHKAAKMMKRSKAIEARRQDAIEEKSALLRDRETAEKLLIQPLTYHSRTLLTVQDAAVCYDGRPVCEPVRFEIQQGDRLLLTGPNGSGKSSLLRLLAGEPLAHTGTVTLRSGLILSCLPQDTGHLSGSLSDFARQHQLDLTRFLTLLRKLDFERVQFDKPLESLSAGQKKKVLLARSLCEQAHLYLWDEPLNYIDLYSRMQIENLILECCPTMILIEHDRAFQERIATSRIELLT